MLDVSVTGYLSSKKLQLFIVNRSSGTHCVVSLFKAKLISKVNVKYQFGSFQNVVCNIVKIWNAYNALCTAQNYNIVIELQLRN